jgi:16S rRNA G527 N7-methylase RsmG
VLKYVESFIELCQSSTLELKNEVFVQLMRQANSNYELTAIRNYQAMAVFLHVYNPAE